MYIYINTYVHTYMHACIHTYIYIFIVYIYIKCVFIYWDTTIANGVINQQTYLGLILPAVFLLQHDMPRFTVGRGAPRGFGSQGAT